MSVPVENGTNSESSCEKAPSLITEAVVIGNGPSGLASSFLLSGYEPLLLKRTCPKTTASEKSVHCTDDCKAAEGNNSLDCPQKYHPDDVLSPRIQKLAEGSTESVSLFEQTETLRELADGLSGRSQHPLSLLFDALQRPTDEYGEEGPSVVRWSHNAKRSVSHLVIGSGPLGGAWNNMNGNLDTLSYGNWMELPGYSMAQWSRDELKDDQDFHPQRRVSRATVLHYYQAYAKHMGLLDNMLENMTVEKLEIMHPKDSSETSKTHDSGFENDSDAESVSSATYSSSDPESFGSFDEASLRSSVGSTDMAKSKASKRSKRWKITTRSHVGDKDCTMHIYADEIILATGTTEVPRWLGCKGEDLSHVTHSLKKWENLVDEEYEASCTQATDEPGQLQHKPVLVVGSGLSALDAVVCALEKGLRVMHIFNDAPCSRDFVVRKLPASEYPKYTGLYELMRASCKKCKVDPAKKRANARKIIPEEWIELYDPRHGWRFAKMSDDGVATLCSNCCCYEVPVAAAGVFIGSLPNLSFLPQQILEAGLAHSSEEPLHPKRNPLKVNDPFIGEVAVAPGQGLYAVGPLVGENFVRFGIGTCVGPVLDIFSHSFQRQRQRLAVTISARHSVTSDHHHERTSHVDDTGELTPVISPQLAATTPPEEDAIAKDLSGKVDIGREAVAKATAIITKPLPNDSSTVTVVEKNGKRSSSRSRTKKQTRRRSYVIQQHRRNKLIAQQRLSTRLPEGAYSSMRDVSDIVSSSDAQALEAEHGDEREHLGPRQRYATVNF
eukprot:Clim_evm21s9 gene=Clim_evmTU21s9